MGKWYVVKQGDCLSSIAKKYGFTSWKVIYEHAENAGFRNKRPNPNTIFPGDRIFLPSPESKEISGATEALHRFKVHSSMTLLRLVLKDPDGEPFADKRYELIVGNTTHEDVTDSEGKLEQHVPADETQGRLLLYPEDSNDFTYKWNLHIGKLDPLETLTGVQARLHNLGFRCGKIDGILGPLTRGALCAFQKYYGLQETGAVDDTTLQELLEKHDGA
jgi:N-acetylmuramoyl-L-alanine amidase